MRRTVVSLSFILLAASLLLALCGCSEIGEYFDVNFTTPKPSPISATNEIALPSKTPEPTEKANMLEYSAGDGKWRVACGAFDIDIEETHIGQSRAYVADVVIRDMSALRSAYAYDTFESKHKEAPSEIAKRHNAVFAVNGDYYSYRSDGIIVRNAKLDRNHPAREMLAVFEDGHMEIINERKTDVEALMKRGLIQTFSFGPALVENGMAIEDFSSSNIKNSNPRTGVGQIEPGHFVFVVIDGRQEDSHGMTLKDFAKVFESYGCKLAYNFDGGASSTMIFMGEHINTPSGNLAVEAGEERLVSDILFLAVPEEAK